MDELIRIAKAGEHSLMIHSEALAEHVRLGWHQVEAEVENLTRSKRPAVKDTPNTDAVPNSEA